MTRAKTNATEDNIPQGELDGITLSIEPATDLPVSQERTLTQKALDLVRNASKGSEPEADADASPKPRKKAAKKTPASTFFQKKSPLIASGLIWTLVSLAPKLNETFEINGEKHQLAPTNKQAEDIVKPLACILDRHIEISELHPDVSDAGDCIAAIVAYGFELKASLMMLEAVREHEKREYRNTNKAFIPNGVGEASTPYSF